jgi:hypothetical protein
VIEEVASALGDSDRGELGGGSSMRCFALYSPIVLSTIFGLNGIRPVLLNALV